MIFVIAILFFVILSFWWFGDRELEFVSLLLCMSFLFGFALILYLLSGNYELGLALDMERQQLDNFRLMVIESPNDLQGWLGLLGYYFAVGDFAGGTEILDRALFYHSDNEKLLQLKRYLDSR